MRQISDLCYEAHKTALQHGFWDNQSPYHITVQLSKLALIVSEVGECIEAFRKSDYTNVREELADICIRVFDLCGALDINLDHEIQRKMDYNESRPFKHGKLA